MKGTLKKIIAILVALILTGIASVGILMNQKGIVNIFSNNVNQPLDLQVVNYDDHNYGTDSNPKYACVVINNSNFGSFSSNVSREGWLGEIFIGGSISGYAGHYYWNATNDSGYCMDKSADVAGTAVNSNSLYVNKGSIYDRTTKSEEVQHKVEWLFDNFARVNIAYVSANESLENIPLSEEEFYKKNLADVIVRYGSKDSGEKYSMQEAEGIINGIDNTGIFYVQQWAMWKYVSPGVKEGGRVFKNNEEKILYNALLAGAEANSNYNSTGNEDVEFRKNNVSIEKRDNDVVLGPLTIDNPTGKLFKLHYEGFTVNGKKIDNSNVKVVRADKTTTISNDAYLSTGTNGEEIYIVIKNVNIDKKNVVYNFKGNISVDSYSTLGTYWESTIGMQPVVTLDRVPKMNLIDVSANYSEKEGDYILSVKKIDDKGNAIDLNGNNIFTATVNSEALKVATINKEVVTYDTVKISEDNLEDDVISIMEHSAIEGYQKYGKVIKINIEKTYNGELRKYVGSVGEVRIDDEVAERTPVSGGFSYDNGNVIISWNDGNISVRVKNNLDKKYRFMLEKMNLDDKYLGDVVFAVKKASKNDSRITEWTNTPLLDFDDGEYLSNLFNVVDNGESDLYLFEETTAPSGYMKLDQKFVLELVKSANSRGEFAISAARLYKFATTEEIRFSDLNTNSSKFVDELTESGTIEVKDDDDDTLFKVSVGDFTRSDSLFMIHILNKKIDLSLRKMITQVADVDTNGDVVKTYDITRQSLTDMSWVETESLKNSNNAVYRMNKKPVEVSVGQEVTYALMVFNEGEVEGRALEITDYIPQGLTVKEVHYRNESRAMTQSNTPVNASTATENSYYYDRENGVLSIALGFAYTLNPRVKNGNQFNLSHDYVTVTCVVNENAEGILTNVAEISKYKFLNEEIASDIDSTSNNWVSPIGNKLTADKSSESWRNYTNNHDEYLKGYNSVVSQDSSISGVVGDDDDFEKLIIKGSYSLNLKKVNSDNNNPISDVLFNISIKDSTKSTTETLNNVALSSGEWSYSGELSPTSSTTGQDTITVTLEEIENANYIQLDKELKLILVRENANIVGYSFVYDNSAQGGVYTETKTFKCTGENGVTLDVTVEFNENSNLINIIIGNKAEVDDSYSLKLRKISSSTNTPLQGVTFSIDKYSYKNTADREASKTSFDLDATDANGYTNTINNEINFDNYENVDEYVIKEINLGSNTEYTKLNTDITLEVNKIYNQWYNTFGLGSYYIKYGDRVIEGSGRDTITITENGVNFYCGVQMNEEDKSFNITITNAPNNPLPIQIKKVDAVYGNTVTGTQFTIKKGDIVLYENIDTTGFVNIEDNVEANVSELIYKIYEENAASGYDNILAGKYIKLKVNLSQGVAGSATVEVYNLDDTRDANLDTYVRATIEPGTSRPKVVVIVRNPETDKTIDLALKKIITEIDGTEVKASNGISAEFDRLTEGTYSFRINTEPLRNGATNAEYYLNKTPVAVKIGSVVKYQIRIYNESSENDATASKIVDYMPEGLRLINVYYKNETTPLVSGTDYTYNSNNNTVEINVLNNKQLISKFDNELHYDYVTVECSVESGAKGILTNVAEIKEYKIAEGLVNTDRDSQAGNWKNPIDGIPAHNAGITKDVPLWIGYRGNVVNVYEEGQFKNYLGQQDDDDFEKIVVKEVDLVLKKIITKVNDKTTDQLPIQYRRFQNGEVVVDTTELIQNSKVTTAKYYLNKTPIVCSIDDTITYDIRIYNEGSVRATASEITDYIPMGLTVTSVSYNGEALTWMRDYTLDSTNVLKIMGLKDKFIEEFKGTRYNVVAPSYETITVTCKVNGNVKGLLTNVAEITKYQVETGEFTADRDSQTVGNGEFQSPGRSNKLTLNGKRGTSWANYYNSNIVGGQFMNYEGQQDDDDFEKIKVNSGFEVYLRKVSAQDSNIKVAGVTFDIDGTQYVTDENGVTENTPIYEMRSITDLDRVVITEVSTADSSFIKLRNPIWLYIRKLEKADGSAGIRGIYVNTVDDNSQGPNTMYFDTTEVTSHSFYAEDEEGNRCEVVLEIEEDTQNIGNRIISLTIENAIRGSYPISIKKVNEKGETISNMNFDIVYGPFYDRHFETVVTGEDGIGRLSSEIEITKDNLNEKDRFNIFEANYESNYYAIDEEVRLYVSKIYNEETNKYEAFAVSLMYLNDKTQYSNSVELNNVKLKNTDKTVKVSATCVNGEIIVTIENIEKVFDLALRKFITHVNDEPVEVSRKPVVDTTRLVNYESTTADYGTKPEPLEVKRNDVIRYTIRVYNEGNKYGYAQLILDDIPEGLEMIEPGNELEGKSSINKDYRWKMLRKAGSTDSLENAYSYNNEMYVETSDAKEAVLIASDFLSYEYGQALLMDEIDVNPNILSAFYPAIMDIPDSKDVVVEFKVKNNAESEKIITNYAQIAEDCDEENNEVTDRDSTPNVWEESPRDDDQDIERVFVSKDKTFDLSLRKFISGLNGNEIAKSREPQPDTTDLLSGNSTTAYYGEKPEELLVNPSDIVEYTIRVYNEGEADGYASVVMDDVPDGVEMVAPKFDENGNALNTNAIYNWKMLKKVGNNSIYKTADTITFDGEKYVLTEDEKEADIVVTDYLSFDKGGDDNLIKAFDVENNVLDYKDLKVEFKVKANNIANRIITNHAQIVEDKNNEDENIKDRDSTPNKWIEDEDDQDIENIKVSFFDLSLKKWVTKAIVTDNGKTTEYESKHTETDKNNLLNVSIPKDRVNDISVKFEYIIKVKNDGPIEGYAKEIKDHIPEGLRFEAQDNIKYGWVLEEDGTITTDYLKDTLLKKDETAEVVVVLTWINGSDNLGKKVNFAEISKDYNDYEDSDDIDSTPDNFVEEVREDDEDLDEVMLTIRTGFASKINIVVITGAVIIIALIGCVVILKRRA